MKKENYLLTILKSGKTVFMHLCYEEIQRKR